ncbi:periplasmic binding protein-like I [Gongronella butleri]|nr:periplasmic binding protein-like I [Gongronella butleri]
MTSVSLFGRSIVQDANSTIKPLDNDTFIIRPAWNTSGLTELRFGILLPFSQTESNVTARVVWGGTSAVRMAINTINSQQMITGAYISLILRDSYPDTNVSNQIAVANAVYASVTLMQQQIIGLIGDISSSWTGLSAIISTALMMPQCSFTSNAMMLSDKSMYKYFFRTIPTQVIFADAMVSFIASQGWAKIGVIYADTSLGQQFFQRAILQAEAHGMDIVQSQAFDPKLEDLTFSIKNVTDSAARVILVAATEVAVAEIVTRAALEGYMNKEYTWLLLGTPDQVLEARIELHNENSTAGPPLSLNSTFNGLFMFDYWFSLNGYAPFDDFARQWAALNVSSYPMAGTSSVFSNEGLAYSCMMMMANGYKRMLDASQNRTGALYSLTAGDRHEYMVPDAFNTGYIGPNGPMTLDSNGDLSQGNFLIYNMQHGQNIQVGRGLSGDLKLTHPLMFYDGTATPPPDTPVSLAMNPSYTSPVSLAILTVSALGILFALIAFCMVILYRKHEVFKASSPLFCCLELIGFVLTYVSVIEMLDFPTVSTCYLQPITFTLGFLLVLGPLIAKNYRIYRIFKNVFLTRNVITDWQLIKLTSMVVIVDMILLMVGLCLTRPEPMRRKVPPAAYYWECGTNGSSDLRFAFLIISGVYGALLLLVATYLVYQTRLAGKHYHRYSECRQMGLCVYFTGSSGVASSHRRRQRRTRRKTSSHRSSNQRWKRTKSTRRCMIS